ncbi:MAG TPA: MFS transporter, partial [Clostridiales bacterium]|nr:MFS transporter [Clostridiales bacterium]
GITITLAGVIVGLFSLTSLFSRPFCGLMADRLNNIWLLVVSNVLMSIGLLGFAFTTNVALIFVFRILSGLGFAVGSTVQVSLIIRFIPQDKMGEGIGYMGISQLIGSACAPAVGLAIADTVGMPTTFIAAAALPALTCVMLFFVKNLHQPKRENNRMVAARDIIEPKAFPFTLPYSTLSFVNGIIASYLVLYADERGIMGVSVYFTVYAVFLFLIRPLAGKLMDAKGIQYTVFPGMILTALSMFLLGRSSTLWMILLTALLRAIGQGAAQPSLQAGCINYVGRDRSGVATSTYFLGGDIGQGIGPMVGGALLGRVAGLAGYQLVFSLCGALILLAMTYFYFARRNGRLS